MAANPTAAESSAGELYERFHGEPPKHVDEYHEPTPRPATLTELGDLIEIRVKCCAGWKWRELELQGRGIKLASNAAGSQLYCVGGDQKLSKGDLTALGVDRTKELIDCGEARYVAYRAKKAQVNGVASNYEHGLGEETGVFPRLMYDRRGPVPRILFVGGEYHVEGVGIVN